MKKDFVKQKLKDVEFFEFLKSNYLEFDFKIHYGSRIREKEFNSFEQASDDYTYGNKIDDIEAQLIAWGKILRNPKSSSISILTTCIRIFDWGKVYQSNVVKAIELYENGSLSKFLISSIEYSKSEDLDKIPKDIVWSSGWTKVFALANPNICIYDSRVSAFLNNCLEDFIRSSECNDPGFLKILGKLHNFGGINERKRMVSKELGLKNGYPKSQEGFISNILASWILESIIQEMDLNLDIRGLEKAFFMLGFDLNQINRDG